MFVPLFPGALRSSGPITAIVLRVMNDSTALIPIPTPCPVVTSPAPPRTLSIEAEERLSGPPVIVTPESICASVVLVWSNSVTLPLTDVLSAAAPASAAPTSSAYSSAATPTPPPVSDPIDTPDATVASVVFSRTSAVNEPRPRRACHSCPGA